ncbi:PaaI family thioesterase [Frankia nepalensis]|nr:hotdog domain-containing protein [Frankia nepalensis]
MDLASRPGPAAADRQGAGSPIPPARVADHDGAPISGHIIAELGLSMTDDGSGLRGDAEVTPEMCVPGTATLRTSVLATWADVLAGTVAAQTLDPRIPLTLDLEVQLHAGARAGDRVRAVTTAIKIGQTVLVYETRFLNETSGALVAVVHISFIASPNPQHVFAEGFPRVVNLNGRLALPLAERIGARIVAPGTAEVPRRPDGLNAAGAIQGGLVAVGAEEAAMSLADRPVVLESLTVRYLRPIMIGPARAVAEGHGSLAVIHTTDAGTGKLSIVTTARLADLTP